MFFISHIQIYHIYCPWLQHFISLSPWSHYVFGLSVRPSGCGIFFRICTNVHSDSQMSWLDFGGQRSRSLWPHVHPLLVNSLSQECLEEIFSQSVQTLTWTEGWTGSILEVKGQGYCNLKSCELKISRMYSGIFVRFGTNIHLHSRVNWLDFGGQRSLWPYIFWFGRFCEHIQASSGCFLLLWIQLNILNIKKRFLPITLPHTPPQAFSMTHHCTVTVQQWYSSTH